MAQRIPTPGHLIRYAELSDEQYEEIADRVAKRLEARFYTAVGRWTIKRALMLLGAFGCAGGVFAWVLKAKGIV